MLDTMISRITDVKYTELIMPSLSPLCATIKATSPRVIMPTPILSVSLPLKPQSLDIAPQPMIFVDSATSTNAAENSTMSHVMPLTSVLRPILAKKIGPKIMYELMSSFSSI